MLRCVEFRCLGMRSRIDVYCEWWDILVLMIITCEKSACLFVRNYVLSVCGTKSLNSVKECCKSYGQFSVSSTCGDL